MDENDGGGGGGGGGGFGGDPGEQFHRNEAISAVTDEAFLAEEDDEFDDLYNDVNVGEHFHQSSRKNEDFGVMKEEPSEEKKAVLQMPAPAPPQMDGGVRKFEEPAARAPAGYQQPQQQNVGFRGPGAGGGMKVELGQPSGIKAEEQIGGNSVPNQGAVAVQHQQAQPLLPQGPPSGGGGALVGPGGNVGNVPAEGMVRPGGVNVNGVGGNGYGNMGAGMGVGGGGGGVVGGTGGAGAGQGTILFVGDLHWWTTDAELELEASKYGPVKEVKFYDEKASGKSKGYCQVEFYDPGNATACKEMMNGHLFNGRPCVVAFASPYTVKKMGEAQVNRNQQMAQTAVNQGRRGAGEVAAKPGGSTIATGGNYQGAGPGPGGDNNRGFGRGNWGGRGNNQGGMSGRGGPMGPMRGGRGGMGGRGMMGNGNGFGQGMGGTPPMMHPQAMMAQGFDPGFGGPMGRMGNYGGFPGGPGQPFNGLMPSFPPVGSVGLPGVAPHVNPAFFGRGMPMNNMGMMPTGGVDGPNMGMWGDPNMGGWGGEEHGGGRAGESSYGEDAVSDHQYGTEVTNDRPAWPNAGKEKDRGSERDWSGSSERRYRDDREPGYERDVPREKDTGHENEWPDRKQRDDRDVVRERDRERDRDRDRSRDRERDHRDKSRDRERDRDRHRDDRDRYADHHRHRERESEYDDEWERGRSSRTHNKSRVSHDEELRSRSRDADYGKRRRLTSE